MGAVWSPMSGFKSNSLGHCTLLYELRKRLLWIFKIKLFQIKLRLLSLGAQNEFDWLRNEDFQMGYKFTLDPDEQRAFGTYN